MNSATHDRCFGMTYDEIHPRRTSLCEMVNFHSGIMNFGEVRVNVTSLHKPLGVAIVCSFERKPA